MRRLTRRSARRSPKRFEHSRNSTTGAATDAEATVSGVRSLHVAIALLVAGLLVGCGGSGDDATSTSSEAVTGQPTTAAEATTTAAAETTAAAGTTTAESTASAATTEAGAGTIDIHYQTGSIPPPYNYELDADGRHRRRRRRRGDYALTYRYRDALPEDSTEPVDEDVQWSGVLDPASADLARGILADPDLTGTVDEDAVGGDSWDVSVQAGGERAADGRARRSRPLPRAGLRRRCQRPPGAGRGEAPERPVLIRALEPGDADACDAIMRGLPEWFGLEEGLAECGAGRARGPGARRGRRRRASPGSRRVRRATDAALDITWLAVRRERHGHGLGTALVEAVVERAQAEGATFVTAWTVAASDPDPHYAATRAFYQRRGFAAVAEAEIWGPENPAVLLVRSVTHGATQLT